MEHRPKRANHKRTRSVEKPTTGDNFAVDILSLPNIAELIEYGEITTGVVRPVGCVAVANDEDNCMGHAGQARRRNLGPVAGPAGSSNWQGSHR